MNNFIYITFIEGWQKQWFILCLNDGTPIIDINEAKIYVRTNYNDRYWGLADFSQMKLQNAMVDNF